MAGSWIHETDDYEIETELYSGPLDLLLDLIQKSELDITKIALAQVTDQFLVYVHENEQADPNYISEFMLIASKLVQIKSEAMLPRPPLREPEEEDGLRPDRIRPGVHPPAGGKLHGHAAMQHMARLCCTAV